MATNWMRAKLVKLAAQKAEARLEHRMMEACYSGKPVTPDNPPAFRPAETPATRKVREARERNRKVTFFDDKAARESYARWESYAQACTQPARLWRNGRPVEA